MAMPNGWRTEVEVRDVIDQIKRIDYLLTQTPGKTALVRQREKLVAKAAALNKTTHSRSKLELPL